MKKGKIIQPILWTEWPTGAVMGAGSLWPSLHNGSFTCGKFRGWNQQQVKQWMFHEVPKRNSQVTTPVPLSSEMELNQIQLILLVCFIWRPSAFAQQNYFIMLSPKLKSSFQRTGARTRVLVLIPGSITYVWNWNQN
jgi:hypothetical protein